MTRFSRQYGFERLLLAVLLMYCSDGHVSATRQTTYISFDSIWPSPHFVKQGSVVGVGCLTEVGADTWSKATSHWLVT